MSTEHRTALRLLTLGFLWRNEPQFVVGRKPDFLTFGRGRMWVEVKALDPPPSQALLGFAHDDLKERFDKLDGDYAIDAWVSHDFNQNAAKRAIKSLRKRLVKGLDAAQNLYIGIPSGGYEKSDSLIEFTDTKNKQITLVSPRSKSSTYSCPPGTEPLG